ncbi:MAG: hypothetical protein EOM15_16705, partial [Spirochaetia bacterium]|nr:hypothetical protein [Spirochaetia bacterium]
MNEKYVDVDDAVRVAVKQGKEYADAVDAQTEADKAAADAIADKAAANEQALTTMKTYAERAEDVGKTEKELLELSRKREIAIIAESEADDEAKKAAIKSINAYYDALNNQAAIDKKIADDKVIKDGTDAQAKATEDYEQKLVALTQTTKEAMEAERQRAIASVRLMGGVQEEIDATIDKLNEYYDALRDSTSEKSMIAKTKDMVNQIGGAISSLAGSLESLFSAIYDQRMAELEAEEQAALEAAGVQEDTAEETAQKELELAQQTSDDSVAAIQRRLDAAIAAGDAESASVLQVAIDKQKAADAEIIAEKKAAVERAKIEADYAEKKKKLEYEAAMTSWKLQLASATASAAQAILNGFLTKPFVPAGLIAGVIATGLGAVQIAA